MRFLRNLILSVINVYNYKNTLLYFITLLNYEKVVPKINVVRNLIKFLKFGKLFFIKILVLKDQINGMRELIAKKK